MSNNTSTSVVCDMPPSFFVVRDGLNTFTYYIVAPIFFFSGLFGHLISFRAYYKESRTTSPYMYQAMVMGAESAKIVALALYIMSIRWWCGIAGQGAFWYMSNYVLMWSTSRLVVPITDTIGAASVLLTVAMAADRLLAVARPHTYAGIDHKKYQARVLIASVVISIAANAVDVMRFYLIFDGVKYTMLGDQKYATNIWVIVLVHVRNSVQGVGAAALLVLNAAAIRAFGQLSKQQAGVMNDKRMAERKRSEKTLFFLSVTQCIFMITDKLVWIVYMIASMYPEFNKCAALIYAPLMETNSMICTVASFYVCAFVSKPFRDLMAKHLRTGGGGASHASSSKILPQIQPSVARTSLS